MSAETTPETTAITAAELVLHETGWFARADLEWSDLRGILHDLNEAGLLATTPALPTREQIAKAIDDSLKAEGITWNTPEVWHAQADAVLALFGGQES